MIRRNFKYFIFLLFLIFSVNLNAQKNDDIVNFLTIYNNYLYNNDNYNPFFEGAINFKNGKSVKGKISLNYLENDKYSAILKQDDNWKIIPNSEIENVVLHDNDNSETKFSAINDDGILYRQVYKKNNENFIYDSSNKPLENNLIAPVWIKKKDSLINTFDFWTWGPKKDLINYLSKRDGKEYKSRDFKSLKELYEIF